MRQESPAAISDSGAANLTLAVYILQFELADAAR
jgi:hypothetical protein